MKTNRILPSAFAALLAATTLFAANEKSGGTGAVAAADKNFMVAAAEGGMLEVRLGEIAQKKGAKQDVKEFGAMMVADHGKAGEDLKAIAGFHYHWNQNVRQAPESSSRRATKADLSY
jgi:predicted outer membrane protein